MLRDHLANHSWIYGFPDETKSLPYFILHECDYGDLKNDENFMRLWQDMKASIAKNTGQLPQGIPTPDKPDRSAAGSFNHIMRYLAEAEGKRIWCEKTPMYVHHIPLLADAFPEARFIHIIRDGRDCAASFHRRWRFNPARTIARWKTAVRTGRREGQRLGARYLEVRYEEVTKAPDAAFKDLLAFLSIPFESSVLTTARSNVDMPASSSGKVVRNTRKADAYFGRSVVSRMEAVGGQLLTELGYACSNQSGDNDPSSLRLKLWRITDDIRRFLMVTFRRGRILRPSKWGYIVGRTRNALKQRATEKL